MLSEKLNSNVRRFLEGLAAEGRAPLETLAPVDARQAAIDGLRPHAGVPESVRSIEDISIPGPLGPIPLRIYTPETEAPRPGLVYFHGGGWVVCDLDTHEIVCRAIARRSGAVVVAVDYRLAPEHVFPAAVEDCYAATAWVQENVHRLGIDPKRLAVGGDSAGGNLGAVVSLRSRDEHGPNIALQVLVYPVTNLASIETPSYEEFAEECHLTRAEMIWFRDHYTPNPNSGRTHGHRLSLRLI